LVAPRPAWLYRAERRRKTRAERRELSLDGVVDLAGGVARLRCEMGRAADEWLSKEFGRRCEQGPCGGFGKVAVGAEAEPPGRGQGGKGRETAAKGVAWAPWRLRDYGRNRRRDVSSAVN